ncbi:hypothetical protein [Burkholderia cepacia]|uniref:hypothetical protein n=1 Tax=Burkholderia cepacia TaxID=292 RepID=UPI000F5D7D79|nr:hypothetical protein [Burkholderia cepacia]RQT41938.1 hypothetical protein DF135_02555 [Burkholderia cepacia]
MQTISILLTAGQRYPIKIAGSVLLIQAADQGQNLAVRFFSGGGIAAEVDSVGAGFRAKPDTAFSGIDLLAPVATNVTLTIGTGDVEMQLAQLGVVVTNTPDKPVPVSLVSEPGAPVQVAAPVGQEVNVKVQGTVNVSGATLTATNVGINNTSANPVPVSLISEPGAPVPVTISGQPVSVTPTQAATIAENAPVTVAAFNSSSPNEVQIVAAGARRAVRVRNAGTALLYVGGSGVTPTNAVIVLNPGDVWAETDVPSAALYATSDAGSTANVQVIA